MRILATFCRFPYPLDKGDKLRAFNQIRVLSERHDVFLYCYSKKNIPDEYMSILQGYCKEIHIEKLCFLEQLLSLIKSFFTKLPLQIAAYTTCSGRKHFKSFFGRVKPDVSYFQFVRLAEYSKEVEGRKVLDFQDCLSVNMYRRTKQENLVLSLLLLYESKLLKAYENKVFDFFDATSIITEKDRDLLPSDRKQNTCVIENGVSEDFLDYPSNNNKEYDIIFSGNMSYAPNIMASVFLIKKIMPLVWDKLPNCKVVLAGNNPHKSVKDLQSKRVLVTGWVNDMKEYYAKSKVFVAPMQIGTGLQNKLLEAMAIGLPCVTTPLANDALKSVHGKDILVGQTSEEIAVFIIKLLSNKNLYESIASHGHAFVKKEYSWEKSVQKLEQLL